MRQNIVWTAVIAAVMSVASVVSAALGSVEFSIAFGFSAVASATLSARER